jgi:hypothetical protein
MTRTEALSHNSSYVENALRHVFLAQLFRAVWEHNHADKLHVYNNEVDDSGFDLVASLGGIIRHIQLKATHTRGRAKSISAHVALASAQGGCIVWMSYDAATLDISHYHFFGASVGELMADFSARKTAMTQRRDINGQRKERLNHRIIPRSKFVGPLSIQELRDVLFSGC